MIHSKSNHHGILFQHRIGVVAFLASTIALLIPLSLFTGCQGTPKRKTPIHLNPNMDNQPKYRAQATSAFFGNGGTMRDRVDGTVARGKLYEDQAYYFGIDPETGDTLATSPVQVTMEGLKRGRERFNIYCAVCHGQTGNGKGIVIEKGFLPPPDFHSEKVRNFSDGHIFNVITHGIRNMPAYAQQVPVDDRWLIVNYVRALQRSQNATEADLPANAEISNSQ